MFGHQPAREPVMKAADAGNLGTSSNQSPRNCGMVMTTQVCHIPYTPCVEGKAPAAGFAYPTLRNRTLVSADKVISGT